MAITEPVTQTIKPEHRPRLHPYFTAQPNTVVSYYIKHFTGEGDIILDPFCGTGITALEAILLRRNAVVMDLNPLACLISKINFITPPPLNAVVDAWQKIREAAEAPIRKLYRASNKALEGMEIPYWYPKNVELPANADVRTVEEVFTRRNLMALSILKHNIDAIEDDDVKSLFNFIFAGILGRASKTYNIDRKAAGGGDSAVFRVFRYWVPKKPDERQVFDLFVIRYKRIMNTLLSRAEETAGKGHVAVIQGDAGRIPVKDGKIDYIYTDPPYGANIAYLDLSTIWNAWLGFPVGRATKEKEIIEGGDIDKDETRYEEELGNVFPELFRVLKFDRWLSFVFAHKKVGFWDNIIKAAERAGFEYVNTVVQPWRRPSFHKINKPLSVLSGQLIVNFRKVRSPRTIAITAVGSSVIDLIKNSAELSIVQNSGATTEQIYHDLIPKLLEAGLLGEVRKTLVDITPVLSETFDFDPSDNKWNIPKDTAIGAFIPVKDKIRFYVTDYLKYAERLGKKTNFDDIVLNVMPKLINGEQPTDKDILNELKKIAYSPDGRCWVLKEANNQTAFIFAASPAPSFVTPLSPKSEGGMTHTEVIYRLAKLGRAAGFAVGVGKKEASEFYHGENLGSLANAEWKTRKDIKEFTAKAVNQIDCLWLGDDGGVVFAFEVEHTTAITSGIDRFIELLKLDPGLAGSIVLVCPESRARKLNDILAHSHYIGHPLFMENKLTYLFYKDLVSLYAYFTDNKPSKASVAQALKAKLHIPSF
jgi:DNA modification methylase